MWCNGSIQDCGSCDAGSTPATCPKMKLQQMKLQQLKGTKEYLPEEQIIREKVIDILKKNFKLYGFKPIETSILEYYDIASNKYAGGEEILKETFKLSDQGKRNLCLRYELTFKLAKLFGLNPNLRLPLKRYEIGKIFRDGPIKTGRLREFTQCDVDIIGIKSIAADAELVSLILRVFNDLSISVFVQVSDRRLLFGLCEFCGIPSEKQVSAALSLDKLEKLGEEYVKKELLEKGIQKQAVDKLFSLLKQANTKQTNEEKLKFFKENVKTAQAQEGIKTLQEFFKYCKDFDIIQDIIFTPTLARGLGYYTGFICEVFLKNSKIKSSIAAGGRWDNLISKYLQSEKKYPATGITFGLDVIYEALKEKNFEGFDKRKSCEVIIIPIDTLDFCLKLSKKLRDQEISCIVAVEKSLKAALDYANKEQIPWTIIIGKRELEEDKYTIRDMASSEQKSLSFDEMMALLKEKRRKKYNGTWRRIK